MTVRRIHITIVEESSVFLSPKNLSMIKYFYFVIFIYLVYSTEDIGKFINFFHCIVLMFNKNLPHNGHSHSDTNNILEGSSTGGSYRLRSGDKNELWLRVFIRYTRSSQIGHHTTAA